MPASSRPSTPPAQGSRQTTQAAAVQPPAHPDQRRVLALLRRTLDRLPE